MQRIITFLLFTATCFFCSEAGAQSSSRLIATNTIRYNTSWEEYDTTRIIYSNGNGGDYWDLLNQRLKYDTTHVWAWQAGNAIPAMDEVQKFNAQNKVIEKIYISLYPSTKVIRHITYTYDANGDMVEELHQDWTNNAWVNTFHNVITYDANHNQTVTKMEYWNGTGWGSSYLYVYTFDNNNNMLSNVAATLNTTTMQYDSTNRNVFYYNSNNKVDSSLNYSWNGGWQKSGRGVNFYNASNVNVRYLSENWDAIAGVWVNAYQGFTLLNGNQHYGDSTQRWNSVTNAWVNMSRGLAAYDSNNDGVAYLYQTWDTIANVFENDYVDSMAYNGLHQITWSKKQKWDKVSGVWTGSYAFRNARYHYELYTADVKGMQQDMAMLNIYPSPARNMVNINLTWSKPQDFTVSIYDMQGRIIKQWGEKAVKEYRNAISVTDMISGTYIMEIRGANNRTQQQFSVMH